MVGHREPGWQIENVAGEPSYMHDPADYGDAIHEENVPLRERFNAPFKTPVEAVEGSKMHLMTPSPDRVAETRARHRLDSPRRSLRQILEKPPENMG